MSQPLTKEEKKELKYMNVSQKIRDFAADIGYEHILRQMIEQFDTIEDISNTQSIELFKLITALEDALKSYERLKSDLQFT